MQPSDPDVRLMLAFRDEFREQMRRLRSMSLEERRALLEEMQEKRGAEGAR